MNAREGGALGGVSGIAPDNWNHHWRAFGEAVEGSPSSLYSIQLVMGLLGRPPAGATVLDIGCGQGEFAIHLGQTYPDISIWRVDSSLVGVEIGRASAAVSGVAVSFRQLDLLQQVTLGPNQPPAEYAVCCEVLEHVGDPILLMRSAKSLLAPGCRLIVTVPGGPRSAFDRHIGHLRHFTPPLLRDVLTDAGYSVERVLRAGFPFSNICKVTLITRGRRFISDVENLGSGGRPSKLESTAALFSVQRSSSIARTSRWAGNWQPSRASPARTWENDVESHMRARIDSRKGPPIRGRSQCRGTDVI